MFQRKITDEEFLYSFQAFGFAARPAISHLLCEKLRDDPGIKDDDIKAILLQTLENYYFQTEIVLMLLKSFNQKKINPSKALAALYHNVFIREGDTGDYSEDLLNRIQSWNKQEFIDYIGIKKPEEMINDLSSEKIEELANKFGSKDLSIDQGYTEISNLKNSLETLIANRIEMKDGTRLPFYKMFNKLKHGYQVIEDKSENVLSILIELKDTVLDASTFEVIEIPIKKETAYFYADQTKYMAEATRHLLHLYMYSTNS